MKNKTYFSRIKVILVIILVIVNFNVVFPQSSDTTLFSNWDWLTKSFQSSSREVNEYNENGFRISRTFQVRNGNQWINYYRIDWTYNQEGYLVDAINKDWTDCGWVSSYQIKWIYDDNGNRITKINQNINEENWGNDFQSPVNYDVNRKVIKETDWITAGL